MNEENVMVEGALQIKEEPDTAAITEESDGDRVAPISEEDGEVAERIDAPSENTTHDYSELVRVDIRTLRERFSECAVGLTDISDLKNPHRFAALRDLGLSAEEAYLATGGLKESYDNRAHLGGTVPARTRGSLEIPRGEYEIARDLFSDMSDADIKRLYRKVTK